MNFFNDSVKNQELIKQGFKISQNINPDYNEEILQKLWDEKNPKFPGFNCRITSFTIMRQFLKTSTFSLKDETKSLFLDEEALNNVPFPLFNDTEKKTFKEILLKMFFGIEYVDEPKKEKSNINMVNGEDINVFIDIGIKKAFLGGRKSIQLGDEIVNFDIPAKIKNGEKIRIVGKGALGKNGGKPGDLVIIVNIKNSDTMQLINNDIYITFNLQAYDVALGTVINYRLFNEILNIEIPECTSSGKKIVVKNKGYFIDDNNRGNLVIIINVVFPKELSDDDKKLYLALRENNTYKND